MTVGEVGTILEKELGFKKGTLSLSTTVGPRLKKKTKLKTLFGKKD